MSPYTGLKTGKKKAVSKRTLALAGGVVLVVAGAALFFSNGEFLGETIKTLLSPKTAEVESQAKLLSQSSLKLPPLEKMEWTLDTWEQGRYEIGGEWGELLTWSGRIRLDIKNEINGSFVKSFFEHLSADGEVLWTHYFLFGFDPETRQILSGEKAPADKTVFFIAPNSPTKESYFGFFPGHENIFDFSFVGEESINGVLAYLYESTARVEHNENSSNPPLASDGAYGASSDITIRLWVEPKTGTIIKYEDQAEGFYTDLATGEKIQVYTKWGDAFDEQTIAARVKQFKQVLSR